MNAGLPNLTPPPHYGPAGTQGSLWKLDQPVLWLGPFL